jgi:hypothetical protein
MRMVSCISRMLPKSPNLVPEADFEQILWREHLWRVLNECTFILESMAGIGLAETRTELHYFATALGYTLMEQYAMQ